MQQRGMSSVLLIVMIVMLAGMTNFALRFLSGMQGNAAAQVQVQRAQRAAEAALEWQRYRLRAAANCVGATNLLVPFATGNMQTSIACTRTPAAAHNDGGTVYTYAITVTACAPAAAGVCPNPARPANYVERRLTAVAACSNTAPATCTW